MSVKRRQRLQGMTLIEIMVVIIIVAVAGAGVSLGFGAIMRTKLRSGCNRVMAAARFAYSRAIQQGTTVRIVFNMGDGTLGFEEAHGRVVLARADEDADQEDENDGTGGAVDPWQAARARIENPHETNAPMGASSFSAIPGKKYATQPVAAGVNLHRMWLPHEPRVRETGRGAIYFFPGGYTEHAVVQLSDSGDRIYTVELHQLTARGRVYPEAFEPEDFFDSHDDEDVSDVEDPG